MDGNGDFFDNGHLDMHGYMLHNRNVLVYRNRLDVVMVDVVSVDIVRNMDDNVLTASIRPHNAMERKAEKKETIALETFEAANTVWRAEWVQTGDVVD